MWGCFWFKDDLYCDTVLGPIFPFLIVTTFKWEKF